VATDIRLLQLGRILGLPAETLTPAAAGQAIAERTSDLAAAFFHEAADNDDVISIEAALDYLDGRLAFFGALIPAPANRSIRAFFRASLESWR
jgi:hypothetical protein